MGNLLREKGHRRICNIVVSPTWDSFRDGIKEQYYPIGSYEDQYTRWTTLHQERDQKYQMSPIFSIPYAPNWVSKTLSGIWCSNIVVVCIDTFKHKWIFWTSPHWERLIDTRSRSTRNLSKKCESLDLQTPHNRSRAKAAPTHTKRDQVDMDALRTTSPSCNIRRVMRIRRSVGQMRGGVNQLLLCLNNYASFKFFTRHSMIITIMQENKQWHIQHQSHISDT